MATWEITITCQDAPSKDKQLRPALLVSKNLFAIGRVGTAMQFVAPTPRERAWHATIYGPARPFPDLPSAGLILRLSGQGGKLSHLVELRRSSLWVKRVPLWISSLNATLRPNLDVMSGWRAPSVMSGFAGMVQGR
jgi:hypothetical protein